MKTLRLKGKDVKKAAQLIRQGGLVAFPTETVYGLGADGLSKEAAAKIYEAKGRPSDNPLILHIADLGMLEDLVEEVSGAARTLIEVFWPGPLTLVFKKTDRVPYAVTGGLDTVAVRQPDHPLALALIRAAGRPIAAPSANRSGRPSPTRAAHVLTDLDGRIDAVLSSGPLAVGLESTILDLSGPLPCLLRPGGVTLEEIEKVIGPIIVDPALAGDDQAPRAPGMKYQHYAPQARVILVRADDPQTLVDYVQSQPAGGRLGLMATDAVCGRVDPASSLSLLSLGKKDDKEGLAEVGRRIFDLLRRADDLSLDVLYVEALGEAHLARAIMNRLEKAANHRLIDLRVKKK